CPQTIPFDVLLNEIQSRLGLSSTDAAGWRRDAQILGTRLLNAFLANFIEMYVRPHRFPLEASDRPVGSPMARWQASSGSKVTNLRHENVEINDMAKHLLPLLDGSRDRGELLQNLKQLVAANVLRIQQDSQTVQDPGRIEGLLRSSLDET